MEQETIKLLFLCENEWLKQLFNPIASQVSRLVPLWFTSHLRHWTLNILLFLCQLGWTIVAHFAPVFFFGVDSCWMTDEAASSCFPLIFGLWIIPELSVVDFGGYCSNLMCFCDERQPVGIGSMLKLTHKHRCNMTEENWHHWPWTLQCICIFNINCSDCKPYIFLLCTSINIHKRDDTK